MTINRRTKASLAQQAENLKNQGLYVPQIARQMNLTNAQVTALIYTEPVKTKSSYSICQKF